VAGAQHAAVQRLQFFLSESRWDPERVRGRRLELLLADPATALHGGGVLVIDDSGDRKDGGKTAHVGHQWLGRYGKTDNGVVTVTTLWAGERLYYPVHAVPYTPARHFAKGKSDPGFRTKLAIGADLAARARAAGFAFRAVAADSAYGDQDGFRGELAEAGLPFVMALNPATGPGPTALMPILPRTPPVPWPGTGRMIPATGARWCARSATGAPRPGTPPTPRWAGGDRTAPPAWWWPPPTREPCPARPPGTWPPTCPGSAARARQAARTRPRAWLRSPGSTGSGTGPGRAISRSRTSWDGPTSRSAPISRSAGIRPWSTARSASAGTPGSLISRRSPVLRNRGRSPAAERGGPRAAIEPPTPSWPRALRAVRGWLSPWIALQRWWPAWSKAPPPPQLQALIDSVAAGCSLHLYIRN
jgi:hypothetical protein